LRAAACAGLTVTKISAPKFWASMKAQQVKNAVIVPMGAKGGFVVKRTARSEGGSRRSYQAEGIECYVNYLSAACSPDITDNRHAGDVVPPVNVRPP
jgi:glutamate dehydrogenase